MIFKQFVQPLVLLSLVCGYYAVYATDIDRRVPDEYEHSSLKHVSLLNGGTALVNDVSAVKINPAMIATDIKYEVGAAYNFASLGRDFVQVGIVDSKTARIAAGVLYTGFLDKYDKLPYNFLTKEKDSHTNQRLIIVVAQNFGSFSLGVGGQYVEAWEFQDDLTQKNKIKGVSFTAGLSFLVSPLMRYGVSIENFSNKKIKNYAPQTFRVGGSFLVFRDSITLNLDYKARHRLKNQEYEFKALDNYGFSSEEILQIQKDDSKYDSSEQMIIASSSIKIYDMFDMFLSYGLEVSSAGRSQLGAGLHILNKNSSIFYNIIKSYLNKSEIFQNAGITFNINW